MSIQTKKTLLSVTYSLVLAALCLALVVSPALTAAAWKMVGSAGFSASGVYSPSLVLDSSNTPYVAYTDMANSGKATVMKFNGATWETVGAAGFSAGRAEYTSLAMDSNNTPYVAYKDWANSDKATVMKFNDATWETVGAVGFSAGGTQDISLALDSGNTPYVAYMDGANSEKATVMKFNGATWETVGAVGFSADRADDISLALDSSNTPYVAYADVGNSDKATVMKFNGTTWETVGAAGFSAGGAASISLALDSSNTPYVAYTDADTSDKATVMKFNGTTWETVGSADFSAGWTDEISLALDSSNTPYVAYTDGANSYKATVMKFNGTMWETVGAAGFSAGRADYISLALDSSNTPYVAYRDGDSSGKATVMKYGGAGPQVTLSKLASPSSAKPGEAITYTISFSNTGAITATDVIITDTLSANITNAIFSSSGVALTQVPDSRYVWTTPDLLEGQGGVITITGVLTKPLTAGTLPNTVTLAISGTVQTASADLTVENVAPVADAGVDQSVSLSETVTLVGSGTDDNGDTLTYGWTQTGGTPTVSLSNPASQNPTFTAPSAVTVLTFTLTVTDTGSLTDTDEVVVSVTAGTPGYASLPPAGGTIQFGLDMGGVKVGLTVTSTLTISETGDATLNITSLVLSGTNAADFSVSPTSFSIMDGGAAQPVSITCTPASYGLRTATLTVNHNAAGSPATYTLDCTGKVMVYLPLVLRATP